MPVLAQMDRTLSPRHILALAFAVSMVDNALILSIICDQGYRHSCLRFHRFRSGFINLNFQIGNLVNIHSLNVLIGHSITTQVPDQNISGFSAVSPEI